MPEIFTETCLPLPHREIVPLDTWTSISLHKEQPDDVLAAPALFNSGITKCGITERYPCYSLRGPYTNAQHQFTLVLQGRLTIQIDGKSFQAKAGDLVYCPPGLLFERTSPAQNWWIYFEIKDASPWSEYSRREPYIRNYENTDLLFLHLNRPLGSAKSGKEDAIAVTETHTRSIVDLLRLEFQKVVPQGGMRRRNALNSLVDDIRERPEYPWNLNVMSDRLFVSVKTLMRMVREEFNQTPMEVVITMRLNRAREWLYSSDYTIDEISRRLNYDSTPSFVSLFKKNIGMPPGKYRKRAQDFTRSIGESSQNNSQ